jgi:structure-specific recognition protein 1
VFVPKQYKSARDLFFVRCSIKASDGLLYPLAKSFIFINKPTVIIAFDSVDYIEFKRYEPVANSATRNFDMAVHVKGGGDEDSREYTFLSIDRSEYAFLIDYLTSKELKIKNPQVFSNTVFIRFVR